MMVKGVAFDLDGVLADTSHSHYLAWNDLAVALGFQLPVTFEDRLRGISRLDALGIVLAHGGFEHSYSDREKQGLATWKNDRYLKYIEAYGPDDLVPGTLALLQLLKNHGIGVALASASANARQLLRAMGIMNYFDFIVDATQVVHGKPHPEIFVRACEGLGLLATEVIGIEDAEAGIQSIQSAGMFAVGISQNGGLAHANLELLHLEALYRSIIKNLDT